MTTISCTDEQDWFAKRHDGIGASEAAIVLGVSKYKSPFQLYHEKLGLAIEAKGLEEARAFGLLFEEPIAQYYQKETGRQVLTPRPYTLFRDDEYPYMLATLDRFTRHPDEKRLIPLEIKMADVSLRGQWKDEPPLEYLVQVQHQLAVTGAPIGSVAAVIGGNEFMWCDIARDDTFIAMLRETLGKFWKSLETHEPPTIDGTEATRRTLKALYAKESGEVIALPADAIEWDQELRAIKEERKAKLHALEVEECRLENLIINALGNASAGTLANGIVYIYNTTNRAEYTVAPTTYRTLRRKGTVR